MWAVSGFPQLCLRAVPRFPNRFGSTPAGFLMSVCQDRGSHLLRTGEAGKKCIQNASGEESDSATLCMSKSEVSPI